MLPRNLIQKAAGGQTPRKDTQLVENVPEQTPRIPPTPTNKPPVITKSTPTTPPMPPNRSKQRIQTTTNIENTNENSQTNRREDFKRRAGYLYYTLETIETTVRYITENELDYILLAFPTVYLATQANNVLLNINFVLTPDSLLTYDYIQSTDINKFAEIVERNFNTFAPKINLSMLNLTIRPIQHKILKQNNLIPLNTVLFHEFKDPFIDILELYSTNKLSDFNLPQYLPIPVGMFGNKENPFDISSFESRQCGNYMIYLHHVNGLLYFTLTEIYPDCNNYDELLRGYTILIPIEKLSARILISVLKGI